jgi:hypothetical protein
MGGPRIIRHRHDIADILVKTEVKMYINVNYLKAYRLSKLIFFILKFANIRCFILIAVEIFHNIIHK